MPPLRLTTTLTAAALAAGAAWLPTAAHAAPTVSEDTAVFVDRLPCQSDPGLFQFSLATEDRLHERTTGERYHENSHSAGTFTAVPVMVDERTATVAARSGSASRRPATAAGGSTSRAWPTTRARPSRTTVQRSSTGSSPRPTAADACGSTPAPTLLRQGAQP